MVPKYSHVQSPAALSQLCIDQRSLILQLFHAYIPNALVGFLTGPSSPLYVSLDVEADSLGQDYVLQLLNLENLRSIEAVEMGMPELHHAGLNVLTLVVMGWHQKATTVRGSGPTLEFREGRD